jgi:O-antigen biosynthesis protein
VASERICFLVGSLAISGGTYVILQHASFLQASGFTVTLAVQESFTAKTCAWHDAASQLTCIPFDDARGMTFDLVIATWWKTALDLHGFNSNRYAYFVQSIESNFYPAPEVFLRQLVNSTYTLPVAFITEATWIQAHLLNQYEQSAALVRNGIRKDVYSPVGICVEPRDHYNPRVLVEGHFGVSFKNTALGIRLAKEAGAKDIWVLTGSPINSLPGVSKIFSRVPMVKTAEIYRSCDVLIKLSTVEGMFGPPLEMFHCGGTALVLDVSGHDEYIVDLQNAIVVRNKATDEVVQRLKQLLADTEQLNALKKGALATAAVWPSWNESSAQFQHWVIKTLSAPASNREAIADMVGKAWQAYSANENQRLSSSWQLRVKIKLITSMQRLPKRYVQAIKRWQAIWEVFFVSRTPK